MVEMQHPVGRSLLCWPRVMNYTSQSTLWVEGSIITHIVVPGRNLQKRIDDNNDKNQLQTLNHYCPYSPLDIVNSTYSDACHGLNKIIRSRVQSANYIKVTVPPATIQIVNKTNRQINKNGWKPGSFFKGASQVLTEYKRIIDE